MTRTRLIDPSKLTLEPDPPRAQGASYARTRRRVLRAWKRGEADESLRVLLNGQAVTPDQIDWDRMESDSGPSGESASKATVFVPPDAVGTLEELATLWGVSKGQVVARALREAREREGKS